MESKIDNKEMELYIRQLEEENVRLKNSNKALRNNNKALMQGISKLQKRVNELKKIEQIIQDGTMMIDGVTYCCGYDFGEDVFSKKIKIGYCPICGKKIINKI